MQPLHVYYVVPKIPPRLSALWDLAYNFWFVWNDDIFNIFSIIDHALWRDCEQNPVLFLHHLPQRKLERDIDKPLSRHYG